MTDEKAMRRAAELGMIMPEDTETNTEENTENNSSSATEKLENTQKDTQKQETESEVSKKEENGTEDSKEQDGKITITVEEGDMCRQIANKLYQKGLIKDPDEFRDYMLERGYDNRIRVGEYELEEGMSYKEIANIIISKT